MLQEDTSLKLLQKHKLTIVETIKITYQISLVTTVTISAKKF